MSGDQLHCKRKFDGMDVPTSPSRFAGEVSALSDQGDQRPIA